MSHPLERSPKIYEEATFRAGESVTWRLQTLFYADRSGERTFALRVLRQEDGIDHEIPLSLPFATRLRHPFIVWPPKSYQEVEATTTSISFAFFDPYDELEL